MLDPGGGLPLRLIVGQSHFEMEELEGDRPTFLRLKSLLDGRHSPGQIAELTGLPRAEVDAVVDGFASLGLLRRAAPVEMIPARALIDQLGATLAMWRNQIGFHRLFQGLSQATHRVEVLRGLFIESFHIVRMAPVHIGVALAAARSDKERALLSAYLAEESGHAPFLLETCANLGCDPGEVARAHPIVATTSLIHMPCEIARSDTLAYVAALALFEASPHDGDEGDRSVARVASAYGLPPVHFAPAMRHFREDLDAGHAWMLHALLDGREAVPADRVHVIVNMLHDLKHAYDQFHDGILGYDADISNYIPRLPVDYFSL